MRQARCKGDSLMHYGFWKGMEMSDSTQHAAVLGEGRHRRGEMHHDKACGQESGLAIL